MVEIQHVASFKIHKRIDETLIKRFHIILQVISCGFEIKVPEYEMCCLGTAPYMYSYVPGIICQLH